MTERLFVAIPADVALTIRNAFLPRNPNKMRGADPAVVSAAHQFIAAIGVARPQPLFPEGTFKAGDGNWYRVERVANPTSEKP